MAFILFIFGLSIIALAYIVGKSISPLLIVLAAIYFALMLIYDIYLFRKSFNKESLFSVPYRYMPKMSIRWRDKFGKCHHGEILSNGPHGYMHVREDHTKRLVCVGVDDMDISIMNFIKYLLTRYRDYRATYRRRIYHG